MSSNFTQRLEHAPPPYTLDHTGSSYLSITGNQRSFNPSSQQQITTSGKGKDETKFLTLMQLGSIIILVLCALSCIIALHRNTKIMEQNLDLLERQLELLAANKRAVDTVISGHQRVKRVISSMDVCPPCPTEAPTNPIEPHRNPVSVLNQEFGNNAKYEVNYICEDPHIHIANLTIKDPSYNGISWNGKGRNRQNAKQAAAWEAITNDLTHLIQLVADEYKPGLYDPLCKQPPKNDIFLYQN